MEEENNWEVWRKGGLLTCCMVRGQSAIWNFTATSHQGPLYPRLHYRKIKLKATSFEARERKYILFHGKIKELRNQNKKGGEGLARKTVTPVKKKVC